jgi:hypothetical protein
MGEGGISRMKCVLSYMARQIWKELWENFIGPLITIIIVFVLPIAAASALISLLPEETQTMILAVFFIIISIICVGILIIGAAKELRSLYHEAKYHCLKRQE